MVQKVQKTSLKGQRHNIFTSCFLHESINPLNSIIQVSVMYSFVILSPPGVDFLRVAIVDLWVPCRVDCIRREIWKHLWEFISKWTQKNKVQ
jgi:hypothetical protein